MRPSERSARGDAAFRRPEEELGLQLGNARAIGGLLLLVASFSSTPTRASEPREAGLWLAPSELAALPASGPAWDALLEAANRPVPARGGHKSGHNIYTLASALVAARLRDPDRLQAVARELAAAVGTEAQGNALSMARNTTAYAIAADLVDYRRLDPSGEARFRAWLDQLRTYPHPRRGGCKGETCSLIGKHRTRPNNHGTMAGASRIAVSLYLRDRADVEAAARVFRGYLGERAAWSERGGFVYGSLVWQADARAPVGINPRGATRDGRSLDGVLPDDQRRSGGFRWPPPKENYVWGALQGAYTQALLLERAGHADVWEWGDRALLRAVKWLYDEAQFPAHGDDEWLIHLVNRAYGTSFPAAMPARPGKVAGFTDWTHARPAPSPN